MSCKAILELVGNLRNTPKRNTKNILTVFFVKFEMIYILLMNLTVYEYFKINSVFSKFLVSPTTFQEIYIRI